MTKLESIASSAVRAADKVGASLIIVYTQSGAPKQSYQDTPESASSRFEPPPRGFILKSNTAGACLLCFSPTY